MGLFAERLVVATPKQDVAVPYAAIRAVAILDDLQKDTKGRVLLYLHLDRRAVGPQGLVHAVLGFIG